MLRNISPQWMFDVHHERVDDGCGSKQSKTSTFSYTSSIRVQLSLNPSPIFTTVIHIITIPLLLHHNNPKTQIHTNNLKQQILLSTLQNFLNSSSNSTTEYITLEIEVVDINQKGYDPLNTQRSALVDKQPNSAKEVSNFAPSVYQKHRYRAARALEHTVLAKEVLQVRRPTQSWLMTLASSTDKPSKTFDELMSTPIDFSAYIMNGLKITNLTQETLLGPTFKLLKGTRSNYAELEYDFEECYKALSKKLDWDNPEGGDCHTPIMAETREHNITINHNTRYNIEKTTMHKLQVLRRPSTSNNLE
ncbi:hypothetical protein Tco_0150870 [Tanacetum coccineum]